MRTEPKSSSLTTTLHCHPRISKGSYENEIDITGTTCVMNTAEHH
uniref:Uncharacterized protein n=1 Tax=Anguilla anguilla TaxID=7936 RepID=A0A0E9VBP9_ANGAN